MGNPSKRKGDQAEREAASLLSDLLGTVVRRKLGAGRLDDCGDLDGRRAGAGERWDAVRCGVDPPAGWPVVRGDDAGAVRDGGA
jgi:hypothetical protein